MIPQYIYNFDLSAMPMVETDVLVIGSGIAGLFTAIKASEQHRVLMITKKSLLESNTRYAQGGIAAVIAEDDSPAYHLQDTLVAGAGLCRSEAVEALVNEGPDGVRELIRLGTLFDLENGELALTQEGAHSHRRILHANGDATGYEIVRALAVEVHEHPDIDVWDEHFVVDLITDQGECIGALVLKKMAPKYLSKQKQQCSARAGRDSCTATQPILMWLRLMGWLWHIVQVLSFVIWNLFSSTRHPYVIRERHAS